MRGVDEIYATKGKKTIHLDLVRERPDQALIDQAILGPSGKLRAPALRVGRTLIVGFDDTLYRQVILKRASGPRT